jgi:hypothetical protein
VMKSARRQDGKTARIEEAREIFWPPGCLAASPPRGIRYAG